MVTKAMPRFSDILPPLGALLAGSWLLSTRFLSNYLVDSLSELHYIAFQFLALPAVVWSVIWSVIQLVRAPASARRVVAAVPLGINLLAVALFVVPVPLIEQMDFQRHRAARAEVVRRIEHGELWNGSPSISVAFLPRPDYPTSVSNGAGQRSVAVFREDGALHVLFYPVTGGLLDAHSAILYRADGQPPSQSSPHLFNAVSLEPLENRWYRVHYAERGPAVYVGLLLILLTLTAASTVVVIPFALGICHLGRRARRFGGSSSGSCVEIAEVSSPGGTHGE